MKIVVVEDEIRIREGISRLLGKLKQGYEMEGEAENGQEGLELIRRVKPDVVITDIKMPKMDGLEMLKTMYREGIQAKAIVLSAYSEFEYARKAMSMGVTEYLLKPVTFGDFSQALMHVQQQIGKESLQPEGMGSLEQVFQGILSGTLKPDDSIKDYMSRKYGISDTEPMIQICIYLGSMYEEKAEQVRKKLDAMMNQREDFSYCILHAVYEKSLLAVAYQYKDYHELERWLQYQILQNKKSIGVSVSIGWILSENYTQLKKGFDTLFPYMDWNISLGDDVIISYPKITCVQNVPCTYPVELETELKVALCSDDMNKVESCMERFHRLFQNGALYNPKEIKESYVRFLWAVINIAKEVGILDYQALNQQEMLEIIMNSKKQLELQKVSENLLDKIKPSHKTESGDVNLTVKRAKSMIHEFYQRGITLDEIALKLDITPEYLSSQFHRETGQTFSSYIREYRMSKAKELLIGTQMKLYEIAEKVGYSDAKYFSRMFREYTGQLPAEYRKTHK